MNFENMINIENFEYSSSFTFKIIIDITQNAQSLYQLDLISEYFDINYLTLTNNCNTCISKRKFFAAPSIHDDAKKISQLVKFIEWKSIYIISSADTESLTFSLQVQDFIEFPVSLFTIQLDLSQVLLKKFINRVVKSSGIQNFIVSGSDNFILRFQEAIIATKANKPSFTFIFPSFTSSHIDLENFIVLSQKHTINSISPAHSQYLYLMYLLNNFLSSSSQNFFSQCELYNCANQFELLKVVNNTKIVIANISDNIKITKNEYFDFNLKPKEKAIEIILFVANGTTEANTDYPAASTLYYEGAKYGINKVNKDSSGIRYFVYYTDCGNLAFEFNFTYNCLKKYEKTLPVAYLTSLYTPGVLMNIQALRTMGLNVPQISPSVSYDDLENKSLYKEYLTLGTSYKDYHLGGQSLLIKNFMWNNIIVYGSTDLLFFYKEVVTLITQSGDKVLNPISLAIFPSNYTREDFPQHKEKFDFARSKNCRIFLILSNQPGLILEGLYDAGYRRGEFVSLWIHLVYTLLTSSKTEEIYMKKRKELLIGNLVGNYREWVGDQWTGLKKSFEGLFADTTNMCLTHDTFLAVHNSVEHLISIGEDYEIADVMIGNMRKQRVTGCLGPVYFPDDSNQRSGVRYMFKQVHLNDETGELGLKELVVADRYSLMTAVFVGKAEWAGTLNIPTNFLNIEKCVYSDIRKQNYVSMILYTIIFIITVFFSFLSWKYFKGCEQEFKLNQIISLSDIFVIVFIFLQFFQIISLEPENGIFTISLAKSNFLIGFNLPEYFDYQFENFWKFLHILIGTIFAFIFFTSIYLINTLRRIYDWKTFEKIKAFCKIIGVSLGNILFMPIIDMLLEVFDCPNFDNGLFFMKRVCTEKCYESTHKTYAILSSILLFVYISISTFSRPLWFYTSSESNLSPSIAFISCLSIFQVSLLTIRRTLYPLFPLACILVICIIIFFFTVITWFKTSYNMKKVKIYQIIILIASLWGLIMSVIYTSAVNNYVSFVVCYFGILVILGFGILKSLKYPEGFKAERGIAISNLIRFEFSKGFDQLFCDSIFRKNINHVMKF